MRGLGEALAFLGCLLGGAVLATFLLVAVTAPHFGLVHPNASQQLSGSAFMPAAMPVAMFLGAVAGGIICLRRQRKAAPRNQINTILVAFLAIAVLGTLGLLFFIGKQGS